jgi:hypothetical protein
MGSPCGGLTLVQVAPICAKRMIAAGPGKFSAKLTTRTPRKVESLDIRALNFKAMV